MIDDIQDKLDDYCSSRNYGTRTLLADLEDLRHYIDGLIIRVKRDVEND